MTTSLQELYNAWASGNAGPAERLELLRLLALPENKELALQLIGQAIEWDEAAETPAPALPADRLDLLLQSIVAADAAPATRPGLQGRRVVRFLRTGWVRYAAVIVLVAGAATYLYLRYIDQQHKDRLAQEFAAIQPGRDRAVLTLSDGSTILLDSAANGALAQQGEVLITKTATGAIVYDANGNGEGEVMMNTMTTPRGGQYQLTLPDGTKAWLNAASSLRYPTVFRGDRRSVEVTGEAYFEVAKDRSRPFFVRINNQAEVEVTGTSFNVNAYEDEPGINTTLVEGAIRVIANSGAATTEEDGKPEKQVILKPGQQAKIAYAASGAGALPIAVEKADIEKVTAWKNGIFNFEGSTLKDAMKQLARWYDIEIVYDRGLLNKGLENAVLVGGIRRDLSLSNVLELLNVLGLHFRMEEGRRLVLLP